MHALKGLGLPRQSFSRMLTSQKTLYMLYGSETKVPCCAEQAVKHTHELTEGMIVKEDLRSSLNVAMRSEIISYATQGALQS